MTAFTAPHDLDAEQAVLGAILLTNAVLPVVAGDIGLKPEHFYRSQHQQIYAAMLDLHDRGAGVDHITLADTLKARGHLDNVGGVAELDVLQATVPAAGLARHYADTIVAEAGWRRSLQATYELQAAIADRDRDKFSSAENALTSPGQTASKRTFTTDDLADRLSARIESPTRPERFPWPFTKLNHKTGGGAARGQVTLIAGPTSHGKSVMCDMTLESFSSVQTCRPHLFLNEMNEEERTARTAGRLSGIDWGRIFAGELTADERYAVHSISGTMRFGMTECAGWSARDICREARRHSYDAIAVDLLNKLPYRHQSRTHDLAAASVEFNALAKETGCHVLLVAHVNRNRAGMDGRRPNPTLADVKDCAALADDADNVLFVWRHQDDDTGDPLPSGVIRFGKARGGELGGLEVTFDGKRMRFDPARHLEAA